MAARRLQKLILAGVPEQVNLPIVLAKERGFFAKYGLDLDFKLVPEGTGAMLDKLEQGEVDVALTVTDGFVAGKANGRQVELVGTYVQSPLVWGIYGKPGSNITTSTMRRFGISRMGSGSHTMGIYAASLEGTGASELDFVVANNFAGLRSGLLSGSFDCFMWEVFTTKPWVDNGELRLIGEVSTPWTSFSFVAPTTISSPSSSSSSSSSSSPSSSTSSSSSSSTSKASLIRDALYPALSEGVAAFVNDQEAAVSRICQDYKHTPADARLWLSRCRYALSTAGSGSHTPFAIDIASAIKTVQIMKGCGIVPQDYDVHSLWGKHNQIASFIQ